MDFVHSSNISTFAKVGNLDDVFTEVCSPSYLGILSTSKDERICKKYDGCDIPFYECTLSTTDLRLPFSSFERGYETFGDFSFTTSSWRLDIREVLSILVLIFE